MQKNTKKKTGKNRLILAAAAVITLVGIGVTLALLSVRTNTATNEFMVMGSDDLKAQIVEKEWEKNKDKALTMVPNLKVDKDPAVENLNTTNGGLDEYVALKVTMVRGDGTALNSADYTKLSGLLDIRYDQTSNFGPNWKAYSGTSGNGSIYLYQKVLEPGQISEELFKTVTLKKDTSVSDLDWIKKDLKGFKIVVEGAAVQADGIDLQQAETELTTLLG